MEQKILVICKEQVIDLRNRLSDPEQRAACLAEVARMLDIKSVLLWRADFSAC